MATHKLKAVIFDLDGVLVSTSQFHAGAWANLVRSMGHEPPEDLEEKVKGISRMASLRIALGENARNYFNEELEQFATKKNEHYLELVKGITPDDLFPGVLKLFNGLREAGISIALGSASKNAAPVLENLGIAEYFDAVIDGFKYKHGKPHPDIFQTAARAVGASPAECIVFEDAAAGITSALDGGFVTVGIGSYESLKHAHKFITSLEEVDVEILRSLHACYTAPLWRVVRDEVDAKREAANQTIFTIGNGRIGIRGRTPELPVGDRPGTFIAGFYDKIHRPAHDPDAWSPFLTYWGVPELARDIQIEACIVNCPDFLSMHWEIDGEAIDFTTGKLISLQRDLDLRTGMFAMAAEWQSPQGKHLRLVQRRFADMANTSRIFSQYEIEPLNFSGKLTVRAGIDTSITNGSELKPQKLYEVIDTTNMPNIADDHDAVAVQVKGRADGVVAAFATSLRSPERHDAKWRTETVDDGIYMIAELDIECDKLTHFERVATFATERFHELPLKSAMQILSAAQVETFNEARIESAESWKKIWAASDVVIDGDDANQLGVRFAAYHLIIAASAEDDRVSVPAKALTGEGYRGMVFWDTDIHMTPFYCLTQPERARNLAAFRYHTIQGAREKAAKYGFRGASYPWETGVSGQEECEKWLKLITHQSHITADVAYFIQQYVDCTGDDTFYRDCAAELLIDTARFWLSKCVPDGDQLSIPDAGGPDEFHVVSDNSAYVNNLAIHNLRLASQAVAYLRLHAPAKLEEIKAHTGATDDELARFDDAASRIKTMQKPDGLFEECEGFFELDEFDPKTNKPQNTQTVKQADVLMLHYLLPDAWPVDLLQRNWDYYEPRTVHASSLSHAVHGLLALDLGLHDKARTYVAQSLGMDLFDEMGNAAHGIHMAAQGMNWTAIVRGYGGARPQGDHFLVTPRLPDGWKQLAFNIKWRGADFSVKITPESVTVKNKESAKAALPLMLCGERHVVEPGEAIST